jgi:hypothetical protein
LEGVVKGYETASHALHALQVEERLNTLQH